MEIVMWGAVIAMAIVVLIPTKGERREWAEKHLPMQIIRFRGPHCPMHSDQCLRYRMRTPQGCICRRRWFR